MLSAMLKRQCKLITLVILMTIKFASGQKSQAYEVVNGACQDFLADWFRLSHYNYKLLDKSLPFPNQNSIADFCHDMNMPTSTKVIDTLSTFIPRNEAIKMLSDSSCVGTKWKKKFLQKATLISQKKFDYLTSEEGLKEFQLKTQKGRVRADAKNKTLPLDFDSKYANKCCKISYPIFDSKKEYALIFITDYYWSGCYYLCHLVNGKFDKIVFKNCWHYSI